MTYFKAKGPGALGLSIADRFRPKAILPGTQGIATPESIAFAKTKAEWPRCSYTQRDNRTSPPTVTQKTGGYLYKFKDGTTLCTPNWDQGAYAMVVKGETPSRGIPNLREVQPGTLEYYEWLCKAQGTHPRDEGVQEVRIGFDRAGYQWMPTSDSKGRHWSGYSYPKTPKPRVKPQYIRSCARYIERNTGTGGPGSESAWRARAYIYSVKEQGEAAKETREHRPEACDDPAHKIPPELREACKAALKKNDGTDIEGFKKQVKDMSSRELEDLVYGGAGAGAALPPAPPSGGFLASVSNLPPLYLYGGAAAAVGLIAVLALGGKKKA